jgi:hypothetical protein
VRDAARVQHRDLGVAGELAVTCPEQRVADRDRIGVRDLAAEKANAEARHGGRV